MGRFDDDEERKRKLAEEATKSFIEYNNMVKEQMEAQKNSPFNNMNPEMRHDVTLSLTMSEIASSALFCQMSGIGLNLFPVTPSPHVELKEQRIAAANEKGRIICLIDKCGLDITDFDESKIREHYSIKHKIKVNNIKITKEPKDSDGK